MAQPQQKPRVVIVGAGFAGFNAAQKLSRLAGDTTEIVVINSTDYFLYLPLMPQVTGDRPPTPSPAATTSTTMSGNRLRVATDWALNDITSPELTSLSVISAESVPLDVNNPRA